jgi:hypothetical protein
MRGCWVFVPGYDHALVPRQIIPPLDIGVHRLILICDKFLPARCCRRIGYPAGAGFRQVLTMADG